MPSDVHRDPVRLRGHAARTHELADVLAAALHAPDRPAVFAPGRTADLERLDTAVQRAVRELAELAAALAAAAALGPADSEIADVLRRAAEPGTP
ncbi:hypothetical protein [Pseudonocardia sp. GCM10023141]|uniref:hypothetical protein n=1 Tax=Pseudonocardia sp. GCM10023141 TaxID=3252653 RepID=UPI0036212E8A